MNLDTTELLKRAVKYIVEGLMVAIVAFVIPPEKRQLKLDEIAVIALMAAATFSILDTFVPTMGASARSGAGFGIGANLVGFPKLG
tara:strand:+ start:624 stop:881 length:258 start_codon:yes stop_codon:yes gene_type:complete